MLFSVLTLSSCSVHDDGGTCPELNDTLLTGLRPPALLAQSNVQPDDENISFDVIRDAEPVQANRFMIALIADAQLVGSQLRKPSSLIARIGHFFVSDAKALSCIAPDTLISQQTLEDVSITSNAALSPRYPADSNLVSLFQVATRFTNPVVPDDSINSIFARSEDNRETLTEFLASDPAVPLLMAIVLVIDDVIASQHVFTITYKLEDDIIFTTQSEPVNITP